MEVFKRVTERGDVRICIRFPNKPEADLIHKIKRNDGRYRQSSGGEANCWYVPEENGASLVTALGQHALAVMLMPLLPAPVEQRVRPVVQEVVDVVEPAEEVEAGGARSAKRQRRSGRVHPATACFACLFEVRELNRVGRFVEATMPHDAACGF